MGKRALFEQLVADGVTCIFGNPGTTEQAFMDLLAEYPSITYYLALHESVAIAMADAYGRATHKPAFVEMHIAPGLGNAMGMLYNARVGGSPMVVYVGQSPAAGLFQEPYLSGDLVALARPFTKWAAEITQPADIPQALRRAFKIAEEPPQGPVVLSLPMDILDAEAEVSIEPTRYVHWRTPPPAEAVKEASALLASAQRPALAIGDHVALSSGQDAVIALAELIGAPVLNAFSNQVNAPAGHPLYQARGGVPLHSGSIRRTLETYDLVLAAGTPLFSSIFPDPRGPIPEETRVIHVDYDSWELGKNHPGDLLVRADPARTLEAFREELLRTSTDEDRRRWDKRRSDIESTTLERRRAARLDHQRNWDAVPIAPHRLMAELAAALPANAVIFDESITSGRALEMYLEPWQPWRRFRSRGGGIGGGLPGALGLQVAFPDRLVVGLVPDGASMFTISGLWTAAHYRLPVKYVVCNNRSYRVLKQNLQNYRSGTASGCSFPHMDLTDPELHFDRIAESLGVPGRRVEQPTELSEALRSTFSAEGPMLLDVILESSP
ncbi:MAG: thiamine pyrophosphate-binding protein [Acidobacteriota bacterium]